MRRVRVGVIGAGAWATSSHIPLLASRDDVELVGVCRIGAAELADIAKRFGFSVASENYQDVLTAGIDLCVVSSPAALHYEHAMAALQSGAHVLIEKPMTISASHAHELVATARELKRELVVAFGWNYLPTYRKARVLMKQVGVGQVEHIGVHMGSGTRELLLGKSLSSTGSPADRAESTTWTDPELSGGGYGQAQLSHAFALVLGLSGLRPETVYALGSPPQHHGIELHTSMAIRFGNGATGAVSGMSYPSGSQGNRHQLELRICGSQGQLHLDLERDRLWLWRHESEDLEVELPAGAGIYSCQGPVNAAVDLALGREVVNETPGELGAATVQVLEAARTSMRTGQPVTVPSSQPRASVGPGTHAG